MLGYDEVQVILLQTIWTVLKSSFFFFNRNTLVPLQRDDFVLGECFSLPECYRQDTPCAASVE